ncbi:MAG: DUF1295 domain-containing protein [Pseudomonadota bacterium]|nr:DUF1295 domain-containing protein [Pseudomonadota bacterium]
MEDAQTLDRAPIRDGFVVAGIYIMAIAAGVAVSLLGPGPVVLKLLAGTSAATVVVYLASFITRNASMYDAYWSVAPGSMAVGLVAVGGGDPGRMALAVGLVLLYAIRLTGNWYRGWGGLGHVDWRYQQIEARTGIFWQPVNFLGIHYMPTLMTWAGALPLVPVMLSPGAALGWLDGLGAFITLLGIALEAAADEELRAHRRTRRDASELLRTGLWARCRHPNYLGEMLFWWGLGLLAVASGPDRWMYFAGAIAITILFLGVSIRLIETRLGERKPDYARYRAEVPMLLPRLGTGPRS